MNLIYHIREPIVALCADVQWLSYRIVIPLKATQTSHSSSAVFLQKLLEQKKQLVFIIRHCNILLIGKPDKYYWIVETVNHM